MWVCAFVVSRHVYARARDKSLSRQFGCIILASRLIEVRLLRVARSNLRSIAIIRNGSSIRVPGRAGTIAAQACRLSNVYPEECREFRARGTSLGVLSAIKITAIAVNENPTQNPTRRDAMPLAGFPRGG